MDRDELVEVIDTYEEPLHDLIDELLYEFFKREDDDVTAASLAVRKRRLKRRKESLEEQKKTLRENLKDLEKEVEVIEDVAGELDDDVFEEALRTCSSIPGERRDPNNPAIKRWSEEVGLTAQQFLERLDNRYPVDRFGEPINPARNGPE